jgi:hypothetical protein
MVSWKGACGKHIEESVKVEDVLSWGEGVCEEKPLRLMIGKALFGNKNLVLNPRFIRKSGIAKFD